MELLRAMHGTELNTFYKVKKSVIICTYRQKLFSFLKSLVS
ncbi:uncharacterized protein PRCAT00004309001 [Priceomyces carsonii]|nr:unnamed protein product [Priceomyces carsonii]